MRLKKNSLNSEVSKERFNFLRLKKLEKKKLDEKKLTRKFMREKNVLASQLKKKDSPGKFYKTSVDSKSYFHKSETFLISKRKKTKEDFFLLVKIFKIWKKFEV